MKKPHPAAVLSPRAYQIFSLITDHGEVDAPRLAKELRCSTATVYRSLEELRKKKYVAAKERVTSYDYSLASQVA